MTKIAGVEKQIAQPATSRISGGDDPLALRGVHPNAPRAREPAKRRETDANAWTSSFRRSARLRLLLPRLPRQMVESAALGSDSSRAATWHRRFPHGMDRAGVGEVDCSLRHFPCPETSGDFAGLAVGDCESLAAPVSYLSGNCPFVVMSRDMMPYMFLDINGVC